MCQASAFDRCWAPGGHRLGAETGAQRELAEAGRAVAEAVAVEGRPGALAPGPLA